MARWTVFQDTNVDCPPLLMSWSVRIESALVSQMSKYFCDRSSFHEISKRIFRPDCAIAVWYAMTSPLKSGGRFAPFDGEPGVTKSNLIRSTPLFTTVLASNDFDIMLVWTYQEAN